MVSTRGRWRQALTYLDNEPLRNVRMLPLYRERYMLLTPTGGPFDGLRSVSWREAARLPLCLLTRDMQNRRIIDRLFAEGGAAKPKVAIETNSVACADGACAFGPMVERHSPYLSGPPRPQGRLPLPAFNAIPLVEPEASQAVGLVVSERDPLPPLARALVEVGARERRLAACLSRTARVH